MNSSAYDTHKEAVEAWIKQAPIDYSSKQILQVIDKALHILWRHARSSVSAVLLGAVFNRVIFQVSEKYPFFNALLVTETGVEVKAFYTAARSLDRGIILDSFQLTLIEFLAILGTLTNQVISPDLHFQLLKIPFKIEEEELLCTTGDDS